MNVKEMKKALKRDGWQQIRERLLLVDTLHDLMESRIRGVADPPGISVPKKAAIGWRTRDVRRGTALGVAFRSYLPYSFQVEEARSILLRHAGQIAKYDGKIPVRTTEVRREESGEWTSSVR